MSVRGDGTRVPSPRVLLLVFALTALGASPAPDVAHAVVDRVNEIRGRHGLAALASDAPLAELAREHACRMADAKRFGHDTGEPFGERVRAAGIAYRAIRENLARIAGGAGHVDRAVSGWMKSEGHRANILSPDFTVTGVGVCGDDAYDVTQLFVRPP